MQRDLSLEGFDKRIAAENRVEAAQKQADERGGPGLSLVPVVEQEIAWPTDLLPPADCATEAGDDHSAPPAATPFDGVDLPASRNRQTGWSADR